MQGIIVTNESLKTYNLQNTIYKNWQKDFLSWPKKAPVLPMRNTVKRGTVNYVNFCDYIHVKFRCSENRKANLKA